MSFLTELVRALADTLHINIELAQLESAVEKSAPLPVSLPNFNSADLTIVLHDDTATVSLSHNEESMSISVHPAKDGALERVRHFLTNWKCIGSDHWSAAPMSTKRCTQSTVVPLADKPICDEHEVAKPSHAADKLVFHPMPLHGGPVPDGNLVGRTHPFFTEGPGTNEPSIPGNDYIDPSLLERPKNLPPGARWDPIAPTKRDPLQSRPRNQFL